MAVDRIYSVASISCIWNAVVLHGLNQVKGYDTHVDDFDYDWHSVNVHQRDTN